jgi:ferritin-like metal-binding protein YciE
MAAEPTARESKLIQYLNEAYAKEKELETALKAHISMTTRDAYKKRLRDHLKETQQQAKGLERRIKALGGKAEALDLPGPDIAGEAAGKAVGAAKKGVALAKGPLHMIRGTGEAEKLLKNAKTELWNEFEEIGNYISIEELANALGDLDTARLAKEYRKQEERMATFLQRLIPQLTKQVVKEEIPAKERRPAAASGTTARRRTGTTAARSRPAASGTRSAAKSTSSNGSRATASGTRKSSSGTSRSSGTRSTSRSTASRSSSSRSTSSRANKS